MPSDILGSEVLEEGAGGKRSFRFIPGPIFGQLLMADEINRASPRTQSALLQAMQEHHVTVRRQSPRRARARSTCSRPRTRSSRKAPIRCRRRSSTAS
jgi:MoxR-like ATPase